MGIFLTLRQWQSSETQLWDDGGAPGYYYSPVAAGKNAWLLGQALFIGVYFGGTLLMFDTVRRALETIPETA